MRTCGGGAGGCWPGSAPTCCSSGPPGPGRSVGCGGGSTSPGSTGGRAPSPPRTPPAPGPRSTPWPAATSPTAPAPHIEGARAKALTDLVAGNATIDTVLTLTVPATAADRAAQQPPPARAPSRGPLPPGPSRRATTGRPGRGRPGRGQRARRRRTGPGLPEVAHRHAGPASTAQVAPCHPVTGALLDHLAPTRTTHAPAHRSDRRRRCRPADTGALDVRSRRRPGSGPTRYRPSSPAWRNGSGPATAAAASPAAPRRRVLRPRPRPALADGPTADANLICLCRRHHRVKQRPGWRVTLAADGSRDLDRPHRPGPHHPPRRRPDQRPRSPAPPRRHRRPRQQSTSRTRTLIPDGPHSELEFLLEHHAAPARGSAQPRPRPGATTTADPTASTSSRPPTTIAVDRDAWHRCPRTPAPSAHDDDQPAF